MENNTTSVLFIRCPDALLAWLKATAKEKGFRSTQEFTLQILRERKDSEVVETAETKPLEIAA